MARELTTTEAQEADELRRQRRRAHVSQEAIARRLGCATSKVSEFENGKYALPWEHDAADYRAALEAEAAPVAGAA